jgi:uncharacterized membrane protein
VIAPTWPTPQQLQAALQKLEGCPGSVVLVAIEQPEVCNFTRVTWSWLSREERKALKAGLERARQKRRKAAEKGLQPVSE